MALDEFGNLYIADIGNNGNRRKNLYILKLKLKEAILQDTVSAEKIKFSYPEQHAFPPDKANLYFDAEALWAKDGMLYILTKNRTEPCDGKGFLYQLPAQTGTYKAKKMGEFSTCTDMIKCWITAADFNPKTNTLAIMTTKNIHLVLFEEEQLTTVNVYEVPGIKQRESIAFSNKENELFIADEFHKILRGGNIYKVSIYD